VVVLTNGDGLNPENLVEIVRQVGETIATGTAAFMAPGLPPLPEPGLRFTVEVLRQGDGLVLKRFGRDFPMAYRRPGRCTVDLPRGGTKTMAFGIGADGRADDMQMNGWALARVSGK